MLNRPNVRPAMQAPGTGGPLPPGRGGPQRGVGLVQVLICLSVIAVASLSSVSSTLTGIHLDEANRDAADSTDVMRQLLEELQAVPFDEFYRRFNADPDDDPDGPGTARGGLFDIPVQHKGRFLDTGPGAPAGTVAYRRAAVTVQIQFPLDGDGVLSEAALDDTWGSFPRDLNGDGEVEAGDRTLDHRLLPVRIALSWTGPRGQSRSMVIVRLFRERHRPEAE